MFTVGAVLAVTALLLSVGVLVLLPVWNRRKGRGVFNG
jgi:hypothetical protein